MEQENLTINEEKSTETVDFWNEILSYVSLSESV